MINDHISDMLTRLKNATMVGHDSVSMPVSKMKVAIAVLLEKEGFIRSYNVQEDEAGLGVLHIELKYGENNMSAILGVKRVSKPGRRMYSKASEIPKVMNGLGVAILSTPEGVLTDKACRKSNVGGEILCYIW